ncbi:MAG TPA: cation diffusion facilitator family transporter [Azospirillaceae bacterium]|nr:cation diffusion facilitator family transporter [Azospirillaceae bacterium]
MGEENGGSDDDRLKRRATYVSVMVAMTLIAAKLVAYVVTDAVSLLSSLIDSTTDLMASVVILLGVNQALKPADFQHRFGHGKAEALAALAQAAFVAGSAVFLGIEAVSRLIHPQPVAESAVGIGVMLFSIVVTAALIAYQRYVVRKTGSLAIGADRLHYSGDLLMNAAVIAALALAQVTGISRIDSLFALGIAAFVLYGARGIAGEALGVLMDRELPEADRERIEAIVRGHEGVRGLHDLRTRSSGVGVFIELHLELDSQLPLAVAHAMTDSVEGGLLDAFPNAEVTIHQEPAGLDDERLDARIARAERARRS